MCEDCAWGRMVRKLGDRFLVYDHDNNVIGEAEPAFKLRVAADSWRLTSPEQRPVKVVNGQVGPSLVFWSICGRTTALLTVIPTVE